MGRHAPRGGRATERVAAVLSSESGESARLAPVTLEDSGRRPDNPVSDVRTTLFIPDVRVAGHSGWRSAIAWTKRVKSVSGRRASPIVALRSPPGSANKVRLIEASTVSSCEFDNEVIGGNTESRTACEFWLGSTKL